MSLIHNSHNPHKTTNPSPAPSGGGGTSTSSDRPIFRLGTDTKIYDDDLTGYTSAHQMWLDRLNAGIRIRQGSDTDEDVAGVTLLSPGRDGVTGKMLEFVYAGTNQESHEIWVQGLPTLPDNTTHVFTHWARVTLAAPIDRVTTEMAIKWFMAFHRNDGVDAGLRNEWATHDYLPGNPIGALAGAMWENLDILDVGSHQAVGPAASDIFNAGLWNRYTYEYRPNTSPGSRDCVSRMWVNDTKIIDICLAQVGVTPIGGWKPWCVLADLDAIGSTTVNFIKTPGNLTTSNLATSFNIDWTELSYWTRPAP